MRTQAVLAFAGALFSLAAAVPMKRDVAVDTVTEVDTVVEVVTSTVWVDPTDSPAAPVSTSAAAPTSAAPVASSAIAQPNPVAAYQAPEHSSHAGDHASHGPEQSKSTPAPAPAPTSTSTPPPPPPPATTSSVYVAPPPAPTTSSYVAPAPAPEPTTPTTTAAPAPAPATSSAAAVSPASSNDGPSNGGQKYTGADMTYYDPSVGYGSCGTIEANSAKIVAVAAGMMNKATMCGKSITISYKGQTTTARITDTCPGCSGTSLDLSQGTWDAISQGADGRAHGAEWWFN